MTDTTTFNSNLSPLRLRKRSQNHVPQRRKKINQSINSNKTKPHSPEHKAVNFQTQHPTNPLLSADTQTKESAVDGEILIFIIIINYCMGCMLRHVHWVGCICEYGLLRWHLSCSYRQAKPASKKHQVFK
jgi:hypothetical protein